MYLQAMCAKHLVTLLGAPETTLLPGTASMYGLDLGGMLCPTGGAECLHAWYLKVINTKWDLISNKERVALTEQYLNADRKPVPCSGCGENLFTEADFAKHFEVPDPRYKNVGHCLRGKR